MIYSFRTLLCHIGFYSSVAVAALGVCVLAPFPRRVAVVFTHRWCDCLLFILRVTVGIRYQFNGLDNIPKEPCIFASKHQSAWETFILYRFIPNTVLITKRELFFIPFFGWAMKKVGFISLEREGKMALRSLLKQCKERVESNHSIIIFPEGTRRPVGATPEYKNGVAVIYQHLQVPCVPIALNTGKFWPSKSWKRYPGTIQVEILPPIPSGVERKPFMDSLVATIEEKMKELI